MFPGIQVRSGRRPPHAAARSQAVIREAGQHSTEAEVLVGLFVRVLHQGLDAEGPAARAVLQEAWRSNKPFRGPLEAQEVRRVCAALRETEQRWQALAVGDSLTVSWLLARNRSTGRGCRRR
jgi:hypothetical protein